MFRKAMISSVEFNTSAPAPSQEGREYCWYTYKDYADGKLPKSRMPFIAVPRNVGSTSHWDPKLAEKQTYSFGMPSFFFRFYFTSAINDVPYSHVNWCQLNATNFYRCNFQGHLSEEEWTRGPNTSLLPKDINPYISLDEYIPSRFALAYKKLEVNMDVCFVALDPERVGDSLMCSGERTDLGDDVLSYNNGKSIDATVIHAHLEHFLTTEY